MRMRARGAGRPGRSPQPGTGRTWPGSCRIMRRLILLTGSFMTRGIHAQCNLCFPEARIPRRAGKTRVLPVLVTSHSRFIIARMIPCRITGTYWRSVGTARRAGRGSAAVIWDNETDLGRRNSYAAWGPAFAGASPPGFLQVTPHDLENKGLSSAHNQFLETVSPEVAGSLWHRDRGKSAIYHSNGTPLSNLFFQLVSSSYEHASLILTSDKNREYGKIASVKMTKFSTAKRLTSRLSLTGYWRPKPSSWR